MRGKQCTKSSCPALYDGDWKTGVIYSRLKSVFWGEVLAKLIMLKLTAPRGTVKRLRGGLTPRTLERKSVNSEAQVVVVDDTKDAYEEARRSDQVVAFGRAMPLKLIRPKAADADDPAVAETKSAGFSWGLDATGAMATSSRGEGVTVAVLDTGIHQQHLAFQDPNLAIIRKNFTTGSPEDEDGHGTHCAGTIFGRDVDGVRIGVAPGVTKALIGKVIGDGAGTEALIDAIQWALAGGANVISMSLGFDFVAFRDELVAQGVPGEAATSEALEAFRENVRLFDALMQINRSQEGLNRSAIVVAAAGNESNRLGPKPFAISRSSPAAAESVISVGAMMQSKNGLRVAEFSNSKPTLVGPGVGIVSAEANVGGALNGLVSMDGTSMACPHVAGLAALHWQAFKTGSRSPSTITPNLLSSCQIDAIDATHRDMTDIGRGLARAPHG